MSKNYLMKVTLMKITPILLAMTVSSPAYAYLDPGTVSIMLQGIIAAIAMATLTFNKYWYKIINFFSKNKDEDEGEEPESDPTEQERT